MNTEDLFKKAHDYTSESLVLLYCEDHPKSKVHNRRGGEREFETVCPFRGDTTPGSFFINLDNGMWIDKSTASPLPKGDLITLVHLKYNISKLEAAKKIIHDAGGQLPEPKPKQKEKPKFTPVIPVPDDKIKLLNDHCKGSYITDNFGAAKTGWKFKDPKGNVWMCVTRHYKEETKKDTGEKYIKKNDVPYHYCTDNKWHAGCMVDKNRHLYNVDLLTPESKVIISEGTKCADVEVKDRVSISWWGGGNQINKYDWKSLKNIEDVIIFPDYDMKKTKFEALLSDENQPGLKTAIAIQKKVKHAKILNIYQWCRDNNKKDGWDIYDAKEEGIDLEKFIEESGFYEDRKVVSDSVYTDNNRSHNDDNIDNNKIKEVSPPPFKFMGHDEGRHYFLVKGSNIIKSISFGAFSNGKLFELAPFSFWGFNFPKKESFDLLCASDWIIRESEMKGFHQKESIRGAGVWMDDERIIINSGLDLYNEQGDQIPNLKTKYYYTHSQKQMGTFSGDVATNEQGLNLLNLFLAQGFETHLEAFITLGWTLIAPFAGILKWRPHIWITGPKNCGKSYFLENFIQELIGSFVHVGSGKDSAPGIYRSIKSDPVPILLDEMEAMNGNRDTIRKIEDKLELARNASSDFSGHITLANMNSGSADSFFIRSPFCFSSVVPYMHGEAIESRILTCRMKDIKLTLNKIERTKNIMKTGLMLDPGIFRRKIFKNIRWTLQYIEILRKVILEETGEVRKADNLSPLFAATYSLVNDGKIPETYKTKLFVLQMIEQFNKVETESDEDKLLRTLFDYVIRISPSDSLSIAELLSSISGNEYKTTDDDNFYTAKQIKEFHDALKRQGLKLHETGGETYLAIATNHNPLKDILAETMYSGQYVEVLKRHTAYKKNLSVAFAGQTKGAVLLKWEIVNNKYFKGDKITEDEIPF